ncbi:hypothetical protein SAMN06296386_106136 [Lachnospiraceae bacterium]|nr:hypothetical protein SAMN06296386_106136 [Lachnospiraceae bacterium]
MRIRNRRVVSFVLAASMVFTMSTATFAEGVQSDITEKIAEGADIVAVDTGEETVGAENSNEPAAINAYEPIDGGKHYYDKITKEQYAQVSDNWGINSDPATWSTATKIVGVNTEYY